jgi:hypothetical protein
VIDQFITGAIKAANNAGVLTHRLLAFARRQSLDIKSTDMNALIIGTADMLRRTLGKNVTLETMLKDGLWPALTDANRPRGDRTRNRRWRRSVTDAARTARRTARDSIRRRAANLSNRHNPGRQEFVVSGGQLSSGQWSGGPMSL